MIPFAQVWPFITSDEHMRKPTPKSQLYKWYEAALAGKKPPITHEPQPGYYARRLVKGGPYVPVAIYMVSPVDDDGNLTGPEYLTCVVDGKLANPEDQWTYVADNPIPESEHRYLEATSRYAKTYDANEPLANPRKAIDHLATPIPEFTPKKRKKRNG